VCSWFLDRGNVHFNPASSTDHLYIEPLLTDPVTDHLVPVFRCLRASVVDVSPFCYSDLGDIARCRRFLNFPITKFLSYPPPSFAPIRFQVVPIWRTLQRFLMYPITANQRPSASIRGRLFPNLGAVASVFLYSLCGEAFGVDLR
jgi:hypothetical protein